MGVSASVVPRSPSHAAEELADPKKLLIKSARSGKEAELALVIQEQGIDPNETDADFSRLRALHFASRHGHSQCVKTLLSLGAEVTCADDWGWQAIHEASLYGHAECLELLLQHGANPNAVAHNGNGPSIPLHYSARHGHLDCVKLLLRYGADWEIGNEYGETPLHCTAMRGHVDCMLALLEAGANINEETLNGLTAAYFSTVCGHNAYLKELIKRGTNINKRYKEPPRTLLHYAAESLRTEVLLTLLENGADPNVPAGKRLLTPLHIAARMGHREITELLLTYKAVIESQSHNGLTPLHHAARCGQTNVGELLIANGADVNATSEDTNETALHMCVQKQDIEFMTLLLRARADLSIRDINGKRAVDLVHGNEEIKRKLNSAMTATVLET